MGVSSPFIRRPVMTTLVMTAILILGVASYRSLPVSDLPNVDFPTIQVSASLPGASPETMASAVATPLERRFSTISGLESMNSASALGRTTVVLQFALDRDIDAAAQDVQSAISLATRDLPRDMTSPPSFRKVNPADSPVLFLALSSSVLPLSVVNQYAETNLAQRISMISGVAQVQVYGSQKYAVRVQADPRALAARQIGLDEISAAIQSGNVNLPVGDLQGNRNAFTLQSSGQLLRAEDYKPLIVAWRDGSPVRLADVAHVFDSVENDKVAAWFGDVRGVILAVQRQPGTNTIAVVDAIKELLPSFRAQIPAAINLDILYDRSGSIRESVDEVKFTLVLTTCLVILVIFLFLRNIRATIIPGLALVLSIVGTFGAMYLLNFNIDNLSLMALTLATGFVVDDAIVMIENIVRHMEKGEKAMDAAHRGSREIGFTIVSMTLSLVSVFIPVLFMPGIMGRLLNEFAVTISVAILISGFISLTQTPMLCSRFLKPLHKENHGVFYNALEWCFNAMLRVYEWTLRPVMRHRFLTLAMLVFLFVATGYLFLRVPKGFVPNEDYGQVMASTEAAQGISFEDMKTHQAKVAGIVRQDPNIAAFMSSVGSGGPTSTGNAGRLFIRLKPREERVGVEEVVRELRAKVAQVPGIRTFVQNTPTINIGGQSTKSQYQFTLQSPSLEDLYHYAPLLEERLRALPGLLDVVTDLLISNPEARVEINRDKASALGVSAQQIEETLYTAYGSRQISTIYAPEDQYRVVLELKPEYRLSPEALSLLYVRSRTGTLVPLNTVATITRGVGPLTVTHLGQLPSVTVSFNLAPGHSLGEAVAQVNRIARELLPGSISTSFQGTAQAFQSSMGGMNVLLVAAILTMYIILGILYESFIHPLTILSGLPAAGVGALLTLMLFGLELNLFSLVGVIMLIGIVKKNAIMMVDFALEAQRNEHLPPRDAIFQACLIRFRPIMMTTMAALMGTLPIALGVGTGSEARRPLGMAVVGGLVLSQLLTLYITPVIYTYMESLLGLFRREKAGPVRQAAEPVAGTSE